jgi:hypothetical protein
MKLQPAITKANGDPWHDGLADDVFRYWEDEEPDADGDYYAEVYVLADDKKAAVVITRFGVSIDFYSGESTHTNIIPDRLFPGRDRIGWDEIERVLRLIERTGGEGCLYSKEEMDALVEEWNRLGEP